MSPQPPPVSILDGWKYGEGRGPPAQWSVQWWHVAPPPPPGGLGELGPTVALATSVVVVAGVPPLPPLVGRGDGFYRHSSSTASQQDKPCDQPRAVSPSARRAFDPYQECVATGLCVRLVLEQKQGGERISFTCRPTAAVTYTAVAGGQRCPAACCQHRLVAEAAGGHRSAHNARRAAHKRRWRGLKHAARDATAVTAAEVVTPSAAETTAQASSALITTVGSVTLNKRDAASHLPAGHLPANDQDKKEE